MVQNELLLHAVLTLAEGGHPSPDRGDMLADAQVDALNEGGVDLPAAGRQHVLDPRMRANHDAMTHPYQAPPPHGLHHLCIEQLRLRHPARLGCWALRLLAR